jgi:hypothetical protein
MKRIFFLLCLIISLKKIHAQTSTGSWNILNIKYSYSYNLSVFGETQLRSLRFYDHFHYYEYKGGIEYNFQKSVRGTLGAGSYQTFAEGGNFVLPKNNNEFRIWPQLTLFQSINKFKIEQRYRAELRFTSRGYRNRFRYRLGISYSFGNNQKDFKPFKISVSNELFFTDKEPYFERNRFLLAFNYKPSKMLSLQAGYLQQFDYRINDEIGRGFVQIGVYIDLARIQNKNSNNESEIKDN